jgi:hypothetical protein
MLRLGQSWNPVDPQSACLARDVFVGDKLVARIVDATADIYMTCAPGVQIFEADVLRNCVWETGDERFPDERSALHSIEKRLNPTGEELERR